MRVLAYGTVGALVDFDGAGLSSADRATQTIALAAALRAALPAADVVVGAGTVGVFGVSVAEVRGALEELPPPAPAVGRSHRIEAVYDGPDRAEVARALGIDVDEVAARHASLEYVVELVGFMPGFAYMSAPGFDLVVPRRASPRTRVEPGSIGIAASFTGIYPLASPGGWNLVARAASATPFDPQRDPPVLFAPGDRVCFVPVLDAPPVPARAEPAMPSALRGLRVVSAPACATVQDIGRAGQLGQGLPPSGPLDGETFEAANVAAGNAPSAAAIEVALGSLEVEACGAGAIVSLDGESAVILAEGERFRVPSSDRAVRYLAVRGGVDVPIVLGARATLIAARLGGHLGRPLRRGDVVAVGDVPPFASPRAIASLGTVEAPLLVDPGPHLSSFPAGAYEALLRGAWTLSPKSDRVGVRLEGARIPRDAPDLALPVPMIRGAIEVTPDGTPIVLGPDHPTTGGYPVLAVVRPSSWPSLARLRPGMPVRFATA
jgi:biotin-dependent carboxylase-like uncharacterized protein